jgi:hypothetical protein
MRIHHSIGGSPLWVRNSKLETMARRGLTQLTSVGTQEFVSFKLPSDRQRGNEASNYADVRSFRGVRFMRHELGSLTTLLIGVLAWTGTTRAWAQGTTAPRATPSSPTRTAALAGELRCSGESAAADAMSANPPTMGVFTGAVPRGKAYSGFDKQNRYVVVVPPGLSLGDAAARVLHELSHLHNGDPPIPPNPTPAQVQQAACLEARAQCDALGEMTQAWEHLCSFPCSTVTSMQNDAMEYARTCQLGPGVSGPATPPCPDAVPGSVPCSSDY